MNRKNLSYKLVVLVASLLLAASLSHSARADDAPALVGVWKLVSFKIQLVDTTETKDALGPKPHGRMILTKNGYITNFRVAAGRKPPKTDADRVELLQTMAVWTGRYRADGNKVIINIDASWTEFLTGTETVRTYSVEGNKLTFTNAISSSLFFPGRAAVGVEIFEREE
ncbi:MAG TPA: lipocalin-like domain-containing protein [Syntrophorhabdales bacterium]|nr:lipocalin-like domain-containing protein [Syntrophorhabdales bacterium]